MSADSKGKRISSTKTKINAAIAGWIQLQLRNGVNISGRTSSVLAMMAKNDLGIDVTELRMARELDRAGIAFERRPIDPPRKELGRNGIILSKLAALEARIAVLEKTLGK